MKTTPRREEERTFQCPWLLSHQNLSPPCIVRFNNGSEATSLFCICLHRTPLRFLSGTSHGETNLTIWKGRGVFPTALCNGNQNRARGRRTNWRGKVEFLYDDEISSHSIPTHLSGVKGIIRWAIYPGLDLSRPIRIVTGLRKQERGILATHPD